MLTHYVLSASFPTFMFIMFSFVLDHVMGAQDIIDMYSRSDEKVEVITHSSFAKEMAKFSECKNYCTLQ